MKNEKLASIRFTVLALLAFMVAHQHPAWTQPMPIPAPSGLVAWWPGDGNCQDVIGNNHGVLHNGATFTPGRVGQAFLFDGTGAKMVAPAFGLPARDRDRTIEFWVRVDAFVPDALNFFAGYGAFGNEWAAFDFGVRVNDAALWCSSWGPVFTAGTLTLGDWHHIAITAEGGSISLYLDAVMVGSRTLPFDTEPDTMFYIGAILDYGGLAWHERLNGAMDEVSVYNRALSAEEIRSIWQAGSAGKINPTPQLRIGALGQHVVVSWPTNSIGFALEISHRIDTRNTWGVYDGPTITIGDQNVAIFLPAESRFFRLVRQ